MESICDIESIAISCAILNVDPDADEHTLENAHQRKIEYFETVSKAYEEVNILLDDVPVCGSYFDEVELQTCASILDVSLDADEKALRKAKIKKALEYHPDKNLPNPEEAANKFREVIRSYDLLSFRIKKKHFCQILGVDENADRYDLLQTYENLSEKFFQERIAYVYLCQVLLDYYYILGVPRDADKLKLKRAYLQKAIVHHPDRNPQRREAAEKMFQRISEAYQVLSDDHTRSIYDRHGRDGLSLQTDRSERSSFIVLRWIRDVRVVAPIMFFLGFFGTHLCRNIMRPMSAGNDEKPVENPDNFDFFY